MLLLAALLAEVTLAAEPARLQLGYHERAIVRVSAAPGARVRLTVNAGSVGEPVESQPGIFTAEYLPPDDTIPRIAILMARAEREGAVETGWLALPLWGQADAVIRGRPLSRITVTIGPNSFGPVKADEAGTATVHVVVPPGVGEARSGKRTIALHVPEIPLLAAVPARARALADREERIEVALLAVMADGQPRTDADFRLKVSRGSVSAAQRAGLGQSSVVWTMPPGAPGKAVLTAALAERPDLKIRAELLLEAGPAASIALQPERPRVIAGEPELAIRVTARDAAGNLAPEKLLFETSFGELAAAEAEPGAWSLRLRVPARFGGRTSLRLTARPLARHAPEGLIEVALVPAAAEVAELAAKPAARADGRSGVEVRLSVRDRYGNPVPAAAPALSADAGSVGPATESSDAYLATWVPPLRREGGRASLIARVGAARTEKRIELMPSSRLLAVSPKLGMLSNFRDLTSPVVAVEGALRTDRFGPRVELLGELSWSFSTATSLASVPPAASVTIHSRTDYFTAALALGAFLPLGDRTLAFLHAGPTLTRVSSSLKLGAEPAASAATLVPGVEISLGVERRMWKTVPFLEARWSFSADPALQRVLSGPLRSFGLSAGARFELL